MKKGFYSALSILITIVMVFSILPVSALASDDALILVGDSDSTATPAATDGDDSDAAATPAATGDDGGNDGLILTGGEDDPDALLECDCESKCTEDELNTDCPVCIDHPEWCVVGVEVPEIAAMSSVAPRTKKLDLTAESVEKQADTTSWGDPTIEDINALSAEGWSWNHSNSTLTLNGLNISHGSFAPTIKLPADSKIELIGSNNTIANTSSGEGITIANIGALTIQGAGSLQVTVNDYLGIYCGNLTVKNGTITVTSGLNTAIMCSNFTMEGGTVTTANSSSSAGVSCSGLNISGGTLTAAGGTVSGSGSFGLNCNGSIAMTGGTIVATGANRAIRNDYTVPAGYSYWVSTTNTPSSAKLAGDGSTTVIGSTHKYAKITKSSPPAPPAPPAPAPSPSPSVGGGSSSPSPAPPPPAPVVAPLSEKIESTMNDAINSAVNASANAAGNDTGTIKAVLKNVSVLTKENVAALIKKAKELGSKATVSSDVMSEDGKYVEVRVTLDPALIKQNVRLDGYVRKSQTLQTESKFKRFCENKVAVISLGQEKSYGQTARISAKLDLKDFNTANLYLYSYDRKANKYTLITSKNYKIDKKGYLIFDTGLGGDIIVSDGKLTKKQG